MGFVVHVQASDPRLGNKSDDHISTSFNDIEEQNDSTLFTSMEGQDICTVHACTHARTYSRTCTCVRTCVYIYLDLLIACTHARTHVRTHAHMYAHTHTHI